MSIGPDDDTPPMGSRPEFLKPGFTKTAEGSHLVIDTRRPDNEPGPLDGLAPELPLAPVPDLSALPLTPTVTERKAAPEGTRPQLDTLPPLKEGELLAPKMKIREQ